MSNLPGPPKSIETGKTLSQFNILAFSVQFELDFVANNIDYNDFYPQMLDLSRVKDDLQLIFFTEFGTFESESLTCLLSNNYKHKITSIISKIIVFFMIIIQSILYILMTSILLVNFRTGASKLH